MSLASRAQRPCVAAAPLWDERQHEFVGMLGAGDFIDIIQLMYNSPQLAGNMSEQELDKHTIANMRAAAVRRCRLNTSG